MEHRTINARYKRSLLSCIVSPSNHNLYAVGGESDYNSPDLIRLNSIEYISTIDIYQNTWQYTSNGLTNVTSQSRVISSDTDIFVIGGRDWNDNPSNLVHVINYYK